MTYNARSLEIIRDIERSVLSVFDTKDDGILMVHFIAMSRGLTKSASFTGEDPDDDASAVCDKIPFDAITELRREMYHPEKGAWLTAIVRLDCFDEDFSITFNFDSRPNIFNEDFIYNDSDSMVSPDREEILADFKKFPRHDIFVPEWVNDLVIEQKLVDNAIAEADPYDLFSEPIDLPAYLVTDYKELSENALWNKVWESLSESYVKQLVTDKSLLPVFVEQSKYSQQAAAIFDILEINLCKKFVKEMSEELTVIERAEFVNKLYEARGQGAQFDVEGDDEIDTDTLDEEFYEVIEEMIASQTKHRFPDIESEYL